MHVSDAQIGVSPHSTGSIQRKRTATVSSRTKLRLSKYIQSLFRNRSAKTKASEGSMNSNDSEILVTEFQKRLKNLPQRQLAEEERGEMQRSHTLEESPRSMRRSIDSERSSKRSNSNDKGPPLGVIDEMPSKIKAFPQIQIEIRRASEVRRDSQFSQYSYGYSLGSPDSDYLPLLTPPPFGSPSDEPYTFTFVARRRASTVVGTLPRIETVHTVPQTTTTPPEVSCLRLMLISLIRHVLGTYAKRDDHLNDVLKETGDVLHQIVNNTSDEATKEWCCNVVQVIAAKDVGEDLDDEMDACDQLNDEYFQFQEQLLTGFFPCSRDEAAVLASIKSVIEDQWPVNKRRFTIHQQILRGDFGKVNELAEKIMVTPWEVDQSIYQTYAKDRSLSSVLNPMSTQRSSQPPPTIVLNNNNDGCGARIPPTTNGTRPPTVEALGGRQSSTRLLLGGSGFVSQAPDGDYGGGGQGILNSTKRKLFGSCILSSNDYVPNVEALNPLLPPEYRNNRRALRLIRASDHKRKLFHSKFYDNEKAMKRFYVQMFKRLPAYGCKIFTVKELLHGKTIKKSNRLLCLSSTNINLLDADTKLLIRTQPTSALSQWRIGGGVSKHHVILEFKQARWQLSAASYVCLRSLSITLWEIMQHSASKMLKCDLIGLAESITDENLNVLLQNDPATINGHRSSGSVGQNVVPNSPEEPVTLYKVELDRLQYILHFPEEVAFQLSHVEHDLFYSIPPIDFVRYVACDLSSLNRELINPSNVRIFIKRFAEVSCWAAHLIVSQPTHNDRRNVLSCILRVIETCWNIGNFNACVEIVSGLKSESLKTFWSSLSDEDRQSFHNMCDILLPGNAIPCHENGAGTADRYIHPQMVSAIQRCLVNTETKIVPFFGVFLKDLYTIFRQSPTLVVLDTDAPEKSKLLPNNEDEEGNHFTTHFGVGGLLNMEKIDMVQSVLGNLETFHKHHNEQLEPKFKNEEMVSSMSKMVSSSMQALDSHHGVSLVPPSNVDDDLIRRRVTIFFKSVYDARINRNPCVRTSIFSRLQNGCTVIHYDLETGRSVLCQIRLDASCGLLIWQKHNWSTSWTVSGSVGSSQQGTSSSATSPKNRNSNEKSKKDVIDGATSQQSPSLGVTTAVVGSTSPFSSTPFSNTRQGNFSCRVFPKFLNNEIALKGLEEGFLELSYVKSIEDKDSYNIDIDAIYKRHCLDEMPVPIQCWTIIYGNYLSENESLCFLSPILITETWKCGLSQVIRELKKQCQSIDRRLLWLKKLYLDLYFEADQGSAPAPAKAIQAYGGRAFWKEQASGFTSLPSDASSYAPSKKSSAISGISLTAAGLKKKRVVPRDSTRRRFLVWIEQPAQYRAPTAPSIRDSEIDKLSFYTGGNCDRRGSVRSHRSVASASAMLPSTSTVVPSPIPSAHSLLKPVDSDEFSIRSRTSTMSQSQHDTAVENSLGMRLDAQSNASEVLQEKQMSFFEMVELRKAFDIRMRKDLRTLFGELCSKHRDKNCAVGSNQNAGGNQPGSATRDSFKTRIMGYGIVTTASSSTDEKSAENSPSENNNIISEIDSLTRNGKLPMRLAEKQLKIYNALASASLGQNSAGVDTSRSMWLNPTHLKNFINEHQLETCDEDEAARIIRTHEPDQMMRSRNRMSFEGFARYMLDRNNFAFVNEDIKMNQTRETLRQGTESELELILNFKDRLQ
uniref:Ras-GEF domain-containing protein n=1 Tax=Romanomermis culicivorax TaxID=13658 RepID=A0A915IXH2_ROMCU